MINIFVIPLNVTLWHIYFTAYCHNLQFQLVGLMVRHSCAVNSGEGTLK